MLQTTIRGPLPNVLAITGAALVILAVAVVARELARASTQLET